MLVEVVDAPNQAAFLVPPSPEVFDVQVADGEHGRRFCQVAADFGPVLQPAIEGSAEKGEGGSAICWCFKAMSWRMTGSRLASQRSNSRFALKTFMMSFENEPLG